jgi:molybdopterin molybdotransferase
MDLGTALEAMIWFNDPDLLACLPRGASESAIAQLESLIGVELPPMVRELYRRHDGIPDCLFSLREVGEGWEVLREYGSQSPLGDVQIQADSGVKAFWWTPLWIPVGGWDGDYVCLDLDPAPGGVVGQVVKVYHDYEARPCQGRSLKEHFWQGHFLFDEWALRMRAARQSRVRPG